MLVKMLELLPNIKFDMMSEMTKVWTTPQYLQAELAQHKLSEAGIESFIMDKRDSSYPGILGHVELHVSTEDVQNAEKILEKFSATQNQD